MTQQWGNELSEMNKKYEEIKGTLKKFNENDENFYF